MTAAWPWRPILAGLALGTLGACAHTLVPLEEEVLLEASDRQRPDWIAGPARSDDRELYWSGRGAATTTAGAIRAARRDAVTETVRFYYGPVIDRFFGVETDESSVFLEDRDSNTSKETQNRAIERILEAGVEAPGYAKLMQQYWERYRIPTDDGAGREIVQAYALVTMERSSADEIVARLLGESPTQIAIAGMVREAAFLVAEAKKEARDGLAAGRSNRVPEMAIAHRRAGELISDLDRVKRRHDKIAKTPLQVDVVEARRAVANLDKLSREVLASLMLSVSVTVYSGAQARIDGLEKFLAMILNDLSIPTAGPQARRCARGHTHWLKASFDPPTCVRPEEGHVCDLALTLDLGRCPSTQRVDRYKVDTTVLRGRGTSDRRAVLAAWAEIRASNLPGLTREIRVLLSKHMPTRPARTSAP